MTPRNIALLCGLLGALMPAGGLHAQQSKVLNVALAGTMEHVISRQIGPAFYGRHRIYAECHSGAVDRFGQSNCFGRTQAGRLHQFGCKRHGAHHGADQ